MRQRVIKDVAEIVIGSERSEIDIVKAKLLALKITITLEAYGILFDEDKFIQAVALNPTLMGVLGTLRLLIPHDDEYSELIHQTMAILIIGFTCRQVSYPLVKEQHHMRYNHTTILKYERPSCWSKDIL